MKGQTMINILGNRKVCCDGLTRRDLLQAGGLTAMGLDLANLMAADQHLDDSEVTSGNLRSTFGRAKHCIVLFLYGSPSQLDTFDPKPESPADIRGPFGTMDTALSGVRISDQLPRLSKILDRTTLVRSISHPHPIHGVAYSLTGIGKVDIPMELNRFDPRHWPSVGSVLEYLDQVDHPDASLPAMPNYVHLPWDQSSRSHPHKRAGLLGGFLGQQYAPVVFEFSGQANRPDSYRPNDPFCGIEPDCQFSITPSGQRHVDLTLDRIDRRKQLLDQFDDQRRHLESTGAGQSLDRFQEMAFRVLGAPSVKDALDLSQESEATRERYGNHLFGQSTLLARRLVEAGTRLVTVFWDEFGISCGGWDTHEKAEARLKDELCPGLDQTLSALLEDLGQRGLLDETVVLCMGEHGRTPKPERRNGLADGRGHWSRAYSGLFAGAGIAEGVVVGESDENAAWVKERPISPKDILKTLYHLLGVDADRMITDNLGRPLPLVADGSIVEEMITT